MRVFVALVLLVGVLSVSAERVASIQEPSSTLQEEPIRRIEREYHPPGRCEVGIEPTVDLAVAEYRATHPMGGQKGKEKIVSQKPCGI